MRIHVTLNKDHIGRAMSFVRKRTLKKNPKQPLYSIARQWKSLAYTYDTNYSHLNKNEPRKLLSTAFVLSTYTL